MLPDVMVCSVITMFADLAILAKYLLIRGIVLHILSDAIPFLVVRFCFFLLCRNELLNTANFNGWMDGCVCCAGMLEKPLPLPQGLQHLHPMLWHCPHNSILASLIRVQVCLHILLLKKIVFSRVVEVKFLVFYHRRVRERQNYICLR